MYIIMSRRLCLAIFLSFVGSTYVEAGVLGVIDIQPIVNRHFVGNSLGVTYNKDNDLLYLSSGSDNRGGYIYTLNSNGDLLNEVNFSDVFRPNWYATTLSYDSASGHVFVTAAGEIAGVYSSSLLEMSSDFQTLYAELFVSGYEHYVRTDGIWARDFGNDLIQHYSHNGTFVSDFSVASSFPGYPGPYALTSDFNGGFLVLDHFGKRIVDVDESGNELLVASTAGLGDGRGLAIDTDIGTGRIFLQVNNEYIYVLSSEFLTNPLPPIPPIAGVPEPSSIAIWCIAAICMGFGRKKLATALR